MHKISIITVVLNSVKTIEDCILSVLNQTQMVEHILIDGASTDGTLNIINNYRNDTSILISEPDNGIYDAMNKGISLSSGDIIGILNADDFYANPNVLSNVLYYFNKLDIDCCYGDLDYVSPNNTNHIFRRWRSGGFNHKKFYWGWMPPHPTFFVKKSIYNSYGLFNPNLGSSADYEIMLRFLLKWKIKVAYIPNVLVKMRYGGISNASLQNRITANLNDRKAWLVNGLTPFPWTLLLKPILKIKQYVI